VDALTTYPKAISGLPNAVGFSVDADQIFV